ncbi:hypothetical protein C5167_022218 [Papaver somniferum]|uniref:Uncharacterized protein n=1 Tax=Papaver somniferum TaxID=3469 RepID=A0A4Y7JK84_PAPSO|nr:hypothetical protein C5167_022218 [Papaver somniferum]
MKMNVLNNSSKEKGKRWVNTLSPYTTSNWEASSLKDNQTVARYVTYVMHGITHNHINDLEQLKTNLCKLALPSSPVGVCKGRADAD